MEINFKAEINLTITEKGIEIFNKSGKTIEEFKEYFKAQLKELILYEVNEQNIMTIEVIIES